MLLLIFHILIVAVHGERILADDATTMIECEGHEVC